MPKLTKRAGENQLQAELRAAHVLRKAAEGGSVASQNGFVFRRSRLTTSVLKRVRR